ncbi:coproporphyrinogen III oxidase [Roseomonas stagni]|uniref:Heme chaperone HemW n=1 Tax=Falsiroseomonas algicola TaxID=2716930 RepID=A0A6M1LTX2_9PROT|nr:radical SAM family heme chaperone HemW [Falsiroseomonas algicola]NGM23617.1 coproporphyrinogen III oxidase [Falsiroseomonas algicola]
MREPLALYIHWPFCAAKCPYCDFNSHVRDRIDQAAFAAALRQELQREADRAGRRPLASIFFGGGTPSLMAPATAAALIEDATRLFDPLPDIEITLEANPTSAELAKLRDFRAAGVNRASLGVQALDPAALAFLGRKHDIREAIAALEAARETFPRLSFDLIYARPGQQEAAWRAELRQALALAADHLSLYQLTIEPGTQFATLFGRGAFTLPEGEEAERLYTATAEEAAAFGLRAYEISNYAKPGAESRHNLAYWRYGDYLGIGAGAHQRLSFADGSLRAARRHRAPEEWLARVQRDGHAVVEEESLSPRDRAREALLMGLRLHEGIDPARIEARSTLPFEECIDRRALDALAEEGLLAWRPDGRLAATADGLLRLDAMLPVLLR